LQDHGERAAKLARAAEEVSSKSRTEPNSLNLIQTQIERLQNAARGTSDAELVAYRQEMEEQRRQAEKRKRKELSTEYLHLANNTGLHGSVLSAMLEHSDDNKSSDSNESESSEDKRKSKKQKKEKKEKKSKKKKAKAKKEKKKKSKSKKARREEADSSSDDSSISSGKELA
jgi:hypothetical protein